MQYQNYSKKYTTTQQENYQIQKIHYKNTNKLKNEFQKNSYYTNGI